MDGLSSASSNSSSSLSAAFKTIGIFPVFFLSTLLLSLNFKLSNFFLTCCSVITTPWCCMHSAITNPNAAFFFLLYIGVWLFSNKHFPTFSIILTNKRSGIFPSSIRVSALESRTNFWTFAVGNGGLEIHSSGMFSSEILKINSYWASFSFIIVKSIILNICHPKSSDSANFIKK